VVFPPAPDFVRGIFPLSAQTCRQSRGLGANSYRKHALLQMLIAALRAAAHRTARDRRPGKRACAFRNLPIKKITHFW
jgi:hypothetical protein